MAGQDLVVIRSSRTGDEEGLRAILFSTFTSTWLPQITAAAAQAFVDEDRPRAYVADCAREFWVAERGGELVGLVHWRADFVHALHVLARHVRTGVGTLLMDHAEAEIARSGHAAARLETDTFNAGSQAFYAARGYRAEARYPDEEWRSGLTTILLVKPLS